MSRRPSVFNLFLLQVRNDGRPKLKHSVPRSVWCGKPRNIQGVNGIMNFGEFDIRLNKNKMANL